MKPEAYTPAEVREIKACLRAYNGKRTRSDTWDQARSLLMGYGIDPKRPPMQFRAKKAAAKRKNPTAKLLAPGTFVYDKFSRWTTDILKSEWKTDPEDGVKFASYTLRTPLSGQLRLGPTYTSGANFISPVPMKALTQPEHQRHHAAAMKRNPSKGTMLAGHPGWFGHVQTAPGNFVEYTRNTSPRKGYYVKTDRVLGSSTLHYNAGRFGDKEGLGDRGLLGIGQFPTRAAAFYACAQDEARQATTKKAKGRTKNPMAYGSHRAPLGGWHGWYRHDSDTEACVITGGPLHGGGYSTQADALGATRKYMHQWEKARLKAARKRHLAKVVRHTNPKKASAPDAAKRKLAMLIWRAKHPDFRSTSDSNLHPSILYLGPKGTSLLPLMTLSEPELQALAENNRATLFKNGRWIGPKSNPLHIVGPPARPPARKLKVPTRKLRDRSSYGYAAIGKVLGSDLVRDLAYWSAGAGATAKLWPVLKAAGQPRKLPQDRVVPEGEYLAVEHVYEGFIQPHVISDARDFVRREVDRYFNLGGY